jgi:hypothetical protein
MIKDKKARVILALVILTYVFSLYLFYLRYVPLVKPFQQILVPILLLVLILTSINSQYGTLFFIFAFPLINSLPYFFGIFENTPHAPTGLVLFLFYFLGFLLYTLFHRSKTSFKDPILKPLVLFSITIFLSGIITFLRYSNFYPFLSDHIYELTTSVYGVKAGGAIMSVVFFSLNYLTALAFFFMFLNTARSRDFLKKTLAVLGLSAFISLSISLFQHLKNIKFGSSPLSFNQDLINATFKDALSFGAFLAIIIPLILGVCFAFKGLIRLLSFSILLFSLYMMLFSGSKSGLLSIMISIILLLIFSLIIIVNLIRTKYISFKKINWATFLIILLVITTFLGGIKFKNYLNKELAASRTLYRVKSMFEQEDVKTVFLGRADTLWKMAVLMIKDYPLSGVGIGGYIIESSNYSKRYATEIGTPESAENYILQVGSELGLVGVILVLWILWEIIRQARRSYLKIPATDNYKFVLIGAIAGIVSFLLIIQTHTFIGSYEIKYTFWLLVGIVFCLGRLSQGKGEDLARKPFFNKTQKVAILIVLLLFSAVHLWNSTHSLSLKSRTEQFGLKQDFGFYQREKTNDGREFRWTRSYGGLTLKIEKPVIAIPLLASHPDIQKKPVKVKIYLVKDFFKQKKLLDEVTLTQSIWKTYEYYIPQEVGKEVILLVKVKRTWNPLKTLGTPDPRNLGVAVGKIKFEDKFGL